MMIAEEVFALLLERGLKLTTAESCTGGMVAAAITDIAGSSKVFERGFVTYSNESKTELLGVAATLLVQNGAVSAEVAAAMAEGALSHSRANIAVSITGIAGPDGGSAEKPVGLVHFAVATRKATRHAVQRFGNLTRSEIRMKATVFALSLVLDQLKAEP
jgi:nicotinamide-nucleotide amidase